MTFDFQPTLKNDLLILRPLRGEDREELYRAASDPLIWDVHPQRDRYQRPVFDIFFDGGIKSKSALVVVDAKTSQMTGSSRYLDWKPADKSVEIGYTFLSRACWGGGYNRAMKKLMMDHAFQFVETIFFYAGEHNLRSRKAIEKIGGEFVGKKISKLADGSPNPSVIYRVHKDKYNL
jgi:RimJ/RimL family protein N-acetyltransferase